MPFSTKPSGSATNFFQLSSTRFHSSEMSPPADCRFSRPLMSESLATSRACNAPWWIESRVCTQPLSAKSSRKWTQPFPTVLSMWRPPSRINCSGSSLNLFQLSFIRFHSSAMSAPAFLDASDSVPPARFASSEMSPPALPISRPEIPVSCSMCLRKSSVSRERSSSSRVFSRWKSLAPLPASRSASMKPETRSSRPYFSSGISGVSTSSLDDLPSSF